MAVIGTFSSFTTARLAIYASQASLNVTGNNIANINTEGYTRQRMDLVSLYSTGQGKYANIFNTNIGYGVLTRGATQLRDPFLDIRYRNENTKLEENSEWMDGLNQMGRILDEVGKGQEGFGVIQGQLANLKGALEELHTAVDSKTHDDLVRGEAQTLADFFNLAAKELETIRENKEMELDVAVTDVNKLLDDIRDLNEKIRTQSIYGDKALELRDARNLALDKLSGYMNIDVTYSMERIDQYTEVEKLTVTIADSKGADGKPIKLVDGVYAGQISVSGKEPVLNPDYDPAAINAAKEQTRKEADEANPLQNWIDSGWIADRTAQLRPEIAAKYPMNDNAPWRRQILSLDRKAEETGAVEARKQYTDGMTDDQKQAILEQEIQKAKDAMKDQYDAIEADWNKTIDERAAYAAKSEAEAQRQGIIEAAVQAKEDEMIAAGGKYVKTDGTFTNDLYEKDANGAIVKDDKGNPVYADGLKLYSNDKRLIQVDPLKDDRGRLMDDPNTVSKRSETVELGDNVLSGKLQAIRELLTEEGEYASSQDLGKTDEERLSDDPDAAIKRGIPYYQKALDTLARQLAKQFNEMNQMDPEVVYQSTKSVIDADGNPVPGGDPDNLQAGEALDYTFLDAEKNPLQVDGKDVTKSRMDALQKTMDEQKKVMDSLQKYPMDPYMTEDEAAEAMQEAQDKWDEANAELLECKQTIQDGGVKDPLYEFYDGGVLFSNNGDNNDPNNITAANISIAIDWAEGPVRILNTKQADYYDKDGNVVKHSSLADNITHMLNQFDAKLEYFAQDVQPDAEESKAMFHGAFEEVFTSLSGTLGLDAYSTSGRVNSYELLTLNLENDRQSVSGVDLNEEATSMMQFSKSYSAACKLLTTLDSMLDKLINGTI